MSLAYLLTLFVLLVILALAAYVDRIYFEMGKFLCPRVPGQHRRLGSRSSSRGCAWAASRSRSRPRCCGSSRSLPSRCSPGLRLYTHTTLLPSLVHDSQGVGDRPLRSSS